MSAHEIRDTNLVPYVYCEASRIIHNTACVLHHIVVTPDGTNPSYVDVYDGESDREPKVLRCRVAKTATRPYTFGHHLKLNRGMYIKFGDNLESVMVSSEPLETFLARELGWEKMRRMT